MSALPAFTPDEFGRAHRLLAAHVTYMLGRKLEEADWSNVYCVAKGIPLQDWSNLNLDVMHGALGLEIKMLRRSADVPITAACGTSPMHPALTRAIRIESLERDADEVMREVFAQYAALIERRRAKVAEKSGGLPPDMRIGWLLWQANLRQFLYFEERMEAPNPDRYRAVWNVVATSVRLGSKNLWIYDRATDKKRYSVTTQAGIKIQPYFDVPAMDDPNLYILTVQGEPQDDGRVRVWVTEATARELESILGALDLTKLSSAIDAANPSKITIDVQDESQSVRELYVSGQAYEKLQAQFDAPSDELRLRSLLAHLRAATGTSQTETAS